MRLRFPIVGKCLGLGLMVSLALPGPGLRAEEPRHDWSRVQALQPGQRIVVKSFKGMDPKVVGTYVSSDGAHLVVRMRNDQTVTIPKDRIRQVVRKRPIRRAVLIGAAAGFAIMASLTLGTAGFAQPEAALYFGGIGAGLGALGGHAVRALRKNFIVYRAENQAPRASKTP